MSDLHNAARYLSGRVGRRIEVMIVCGSGLSHLSELLKDAITIQYTEIPGFSKATVHGHKGELVFGYLDGISCCCMRGRFHYYEGYTMDQIVFPIRALRLMGVKLLIATNAAGGLNENYQVGDIVCIQDHFGGGAAMFGNNPLRGKNDESLGPRFFAISGIVV
jgi:purine-nucleoside phosphorylase